MNKLRTLKAMALAGVLMAALAGPVWAFPPLPSSFYGEAHITDGAPAPGDTVEAFVPGVAGAVGRATLTTYLGQWVYSVDVRGDDDDALGKDGGLANDPITFKINGRIVALGVWQGGTNIELNLHPPDANAGGPYAVNEGASVTLDASSTADWLTSEARLYAWDLDNDGQYHDATGVTTPFSQPDNGSFPVGLKVTDAQGGESYGSATVTVSNVAPIVDAGAEATVGEGSVFARSGSFADPGADMWAATVNYGDGTGAQSLALNPDKTFALSHVYADNGNHSIIVGVTDDDSGSGSDTFAVIVANVNPTANAGGPYTCVAGTSISLSGSATDVSAVDTAAGFTYAWLVNGTLAYSGATPTIANCGIGLNAGIYSVQLTVTDKDGGVGVDTTTLEVINITHSIALVSGWNLVSFNVHPISTAVTDVLASVSGHYDLVYAWDGLTQSWLKYDNVPQSEDSLNTLDETMGFWIRMTSADTLEVVGSPPTTTTIVLHEVGEGWNLVGYPAAMNRALPGVFSGIDFSVAYTYHANEPEDVWKLYDVGGAPWANDLTALSPGWGYWVKVTAAGVWSVSYP